MEEGTLQAILHQQKEWMESLMRSNTATMERILKECSSTPQSQKQNITIPQFRPFEMEKETWESYLFQLQQHFSANRLEDDNLRKAHFLSTCGNHINDLLSKLLGTEDVSMHTFKDLSAKLTKHFQSKMHVLASRCKFLKQKMLPGQSYAEWIADLRGLARDCSFVCPKENCNTSYVDVMIRDMIVFYTPHDPVRIAATQKKNPSLEEVEELVTAYESTQLASSILKGSSTSITPNSSEVNQLNQQTHQKTTSKSFEHSHLRKSCPGCFSQHNRNQCKHLESICDNCQRRGHISSVCLSKKQFDNSGVLHSRHRSKSRGRRTARSTWTNPRQENRSSYGNRHKQAESAHSINLVTAGGTSNGVGVVERVSSAHLESDGHNKKIFVLLHVNQRPLTFQLDTGATCSLIGLDGYNRLGNPRCEPTTRTLKAYGETSVPLKGAINVSVQWKTKTHILPLIVSNLPRGANIMGLDWFQAFGCQILYANDESALQIVSESRESLESDAKGLCKMHEVVFSPGLGCSKLFVAHLTLKPNSQPRYFKYRPVPFAQKEDVRREIERLRELDILRPVETSQWAAPIVVVRKSNGSLRICGDFKVTINSQLEVDRHPVPRIQELFHKIQGGRYFSKIDLSDAYLQIRLDEASKKLCVVSTEFGLFEYQRLPFGTSSSTGIFQRYMEQLTADLEFCVSYLDDVIISGRSNEEHLNNLRIFLERLEHHGLRCRLEKCKFAKSEIEYLGHIIDETGIRPSESRVKAIRELPEPKGVKELEAFIGKVNYYNQFIEDFAQLAAPLNRLRAKGVPFVWGNEQQISFDHLKEKILNVARLVHFQEDLPITLATDASSHGIGAVLSHVYPNGKEKPIAFASKTLDEAQRRYSQIEKEALSIIFGVKKFHQYLFGRQFELITDHQPLVTIFSPSKKLPHITIQRLQRWAIILMGYTYTIRYRPTAQHGNADCLSRLPNGPDREFDQSDESCHQMDEGYTSLMDDFPINSGIVAKCSQQDSTIRRVIEYVQKGWPNSLPPADNMLLPYFRRRLCLSVYANILLFHSEHSRVVVPAKLQQKVLALLHHGHWGITRMKQMARRYCWWPNIDEVIAETVAQCSACQLNSNQSPKEYTSWPTTEEVWERIHIDFAGPFQKAMWLIVVDSKSKFPFVIRMPSITSQATIQALRSIFALEGLPKTIVSDNGTQFTSSEFKIFCQNHSIRHITSAPFNPESNGVAERMVRTFKTAFLKIMDDHKKGEDVLSTFLSTFRSAPDESGTSPAERLHGRQHRTLLSAILPESREQNKKAIRGKLKFSMDQPVFVRQYLRHRKWVAGQIKKTLGRRMYLVVTSEGTCRRHQNQIRARATMTDKPCSFLAENAIFLQQASSQQNSSNVVPISRDRSMTHQQSCLDDSEVHVCPETSPDTIDLDEIGETSGAMQNADSSEAMSLPISEPDPVRAVIVPQSPRRSERLRSKRIRFAPN